MQLNNIYQLTHEIANDNKEERHYLYLSEVPIVIPPFFKNNISKPKLK